MGSNVIHVEAKAGKPGNYSKQQILPCLLIVAKVPFPGKMAGKGKMFKRMEALACPHCPGSDQRQNVKKNGNNGLSRF